MKKEIYLSTLTGMGCAILFILIALSDVFGERSLMLLSAFITSSAVLFHIYRDSKRMKYSIGSFIPVVVILLQPIGVLWYGIRSRGWRFYKVVLNYAIGLTAFIGLCLVIEMLLG
jgi:hypothetical protein